MSTVTLRIFRHGETDWNRVHRFQGSVDIPLNDTGREQALTLRPMLAAFKPEIILSSNLSRAVETAQIASAGLNVPVLTSAQLQECHFGEAEGLTKDEIAAKFGADAFQRYLSPAPHEMDFGFVGGETKRQHHERITRYLREQLHATTFERVAVSAHGGVVWRVIHGSKGAPKETPRIANCAHFTVLFDRVSGEWSFVG